MSIPVLLLATLETKIEETEYLKQALMCCGLFVELIDISLGSMGKVWGAEQKLKRIDQVISTATKQISKRCEQEKIVVLGLGGGTGGEIILSIMQDLPMDMAKVLVTTMPFDPRKSVSDTAITLIPTLIDIEGLNDFLRHVLDDTAAIVAGLATWGQKHTQAPSTSIALSTLGVTKAAGDHIISRLNRAGYETTAFHANGFGGAAFRRLTQESLFLGVIDLTINEIVRLNVEGAHVSMDDRFTFAAHLPRIILPGAMNFFDSGAYDKMLPNWLSRPHYRHSSNFTHVKLNGKNEMKLVALKLSDALNQSTAPCEVILPMGGFSHQDGPGGAIEDEALRMVAADVLEEQARAFTVTRIPYHILAPETASMAVDRLLSHLPERK